MKTLVAAFCLLVPAAGLLAGDPPRIGIQERLGEKIEMTGMLHDEAGLPVTVGDLVNKPTIFTFVYYRCPGICTPLLNDLSRVVEHLDLEPGKDYQILSVSFDPSETPDIAAAKRESYLSSLKRKINPAGWRFLTGDSAQVVRLANSAGFYYERQNGEWIHAGALIVVSPTGIVTRYMNGTQFLPFDVKMALLEASEGRPTPTSARILKFCFSYDPEGRTYALNVTRIASVVVLILAAVFAAVFLRRPAKRPETQGTNA
jgi:protein SCO1/2